MVSCTILFVTMCFVLFWWNWNSNLSLMSVYKKDFWVLLEIRKATPPPPTMSNIANTEATERFKQVMPKGKVNCRHRCWLPIALGVTLFMASSDRWAWFCVGSLWVSLQGDKGLLRGPWPCPTLSVRVLAGHGSSWDCEDNLRRRGSTEVRAG